MTLRAAVRRASVGLGLIAALLALGGCPTAETTDADSSTENPARLDLEAIRDALANQAPTANAGIDASYFVGVRVQLDGQASSDPDADQLTFSWRQIAGTPTVEFVGSTNAAVAEFIAPAVGATPVVLPFRLTVSDGYVSRTDDVQITIVPL